MSVNRALLLAVLVGGAGWATMWFSTDARAGWDSLVYHKHAFEYAGLPADEQDDLSWTLFTRYGSTPLVLYVTEALGGERWGFDVGPNQARFALIYRMRPAYPTMVAAAYPILGTRAPLAVSAFAVVLFVATTFVGLLVLAGLRVAVVATGLGVFNALLTQWLVLLTPDGLAISLWAVTLTTGALWIAQRRPIWLAALGLAVLALCLTRPIGALAPAVFGLSAIGAALARADEWRRFLAAAVVAAVPALAVTAFFAAAGFPGFLDLLQSLPTGHYSSPDIADPIGWIVSNDLYQLTNTLLVGLIGRPLILALLAGGVVGLLLCSKWWTAPFLAALPVVLVSYLLHPSLTEVDRTLAPAWVSVHTGLALLVVLGAVRWRARLLEVADRLSRAEDRIPLA
ncbi:MAG: hypothetical protein ACRDE9_07860 [Candidatus Limnocylindria bacterium]